MNLHAINQAVILGKFREIEGITRAALDGGAQPREIMDQAMVPAMEVVGTKFSEGKIFIPEMMVSAKTMQIALDVLKPLMVGEQTSMVGKVAIGTVKDDLHDIGKNIVISMMQGAGFEVVDLGIDCPPEKFVEAIKEGAQILGLSAILTTVVTNIGVTVEAIEESGLRDQVSILAGGAAVTKTRAIEMGADGYCRDAAEGARRAKELIKQLT
jgi:5-methyltetrahydrofolate--homocysteine methyltransferase